MSEDIKAEEAEEKKQNSHSIFETAKAKQEAYIATFQGGQGQKVLSDILQNCHMLEPERDTDAQNLTFRAGRKDVAINILINMNAQLDDLPTILKGDIK